MAKEDYYSLLGINRNSSEADIKKAYRRLAMKYHPDRNAGDKEAEKKFKTINEAYEVLTDPQKRRAYDAYGHAGVDQSAAGAYHAKDGNFSDIFDDIFGDIFGRATGHASRSGRAVYKGSDLSYTLELSLEEAVRGTEVKIRVPTRVACGACKGSGSKDGAEPTMCRTCGGNGQVRIQQGFFSIQQTCPACRGKGKVITDHCRKCGGNGLVNEEKTLSVKVPAGIDTGDRIRLAGEGEAGPNSGPCGDLYVQIQVREHNIFQRDGIHIYCEVPINFTTAALGGEIEVPTLDGRVKLKIPIETQTGKLFRVRGRGIRSVRNDGPGDLLCKVIVETPVNLDKNQRNILKQLEESMGGQPQKYNPQTSSWLQRVKNFFEEMKF
jgi:molecular chaperone DnaJ